MKKHLQPLRGMKEESPLEFSKIKWMQQRFQNILEKSGYLEYDCPVLEPSELYIKNQEDTHLIQEQVYSFKDKSEQTVVLRPEITPSFARLIGKFSAEIPKPIRWFSIPKCYRYERPQKGRLREFRQLNVDLVGLPGLIGDIEILYLIQTILKEFGILDSVEIRYNHRAILNHLLRNESEQEKWKILKAIDKESTNLENIPPHIISFLQEKNPILAMQNIPNLPKEIQSYWNNLQEILQSDLYRFSPQTVRGLDYYSGIIFEVFSKNKNVLDRAILGGGRYDSFLSQFGKDFPCIGFGLGLYIFQTYIEEVLSQDQKEKINYPKSPYDQNFDRYLVPLDEQDQNAESITNIFNFLKFLRKSAIAEIQLFKKLNPTEIIDKALKNGYSHAIISLKITKLNILATIRDLKNKKTYEECFHLETLNK